MVHLHVMGVSWSAYNRDVTSTQIVLCHIYIYIHWLNDHFAGKLRKVVHKDGISEMSKAGSVDVWVRKSVCDKVKLELLINYLEMITSITYCF